MPFDKLLHIYTNIMQSLARAVYSRESIIILDDVFSGLDAISEDRIFSCLLGRNGLLHRLGTTVILVTHGAHRLSYADHIIVISSHGTVSEQGKFEHLVLMNGYIAGLATRYKENGKTEDARKEEETPTKAMIDDDSPHANAAVDLHRPGGNWAVYHYYFASAGWLKFMSWMGLMIIYSMLVRFLGNAIIRLVVKSMLNSSRSLD
jgi:ATP-binding cassette subfamily C (CFTR/MRP) protein 1